MLGVKERNWPPNLMMAWLRLAFLLKNAHRRPYQIWKSTPLLYLWPLQVLLILNKLNQTSITFTPVLVDGASTFTRCIQFSIFPIQDRFNVRDEIWRLSCQKTRNKCVHHTKRSEAVISFPTTIKNIWVKGISMSLWNLQKTRTIPGMSSAFFCDSSSKPYHFLSIQRRKDYFPQCLFLIIALNGKDCKIPSLPTIDQTQ